MAHLRHVDMGSHGLARDPGRMKQFDVPKLSRSDRPRALRLASPPVTLGVISFMRSASSDARWRDAILLTLTLWLFVAVIFLPLIIIRHWGTGMGSMALDFSTYVVSFAIAMGMFGIRSEEHTSELQSLMRISYAVFCLKKKK